MSKDTEQIGENQETFHPHATESEIETRTDILDVGTKVGNTEIIDCNNAGQFLVQNTAGELSIKTASDLQTDLQTAKITPKPEQLTPPTIEPAKPDIEQATQQYLEKPVDPKQTAEITKLATVEITESADPETPQSLKSGQRLVKLFEARKNKIAELNTQTELGKITELKYENIDNLFYALAVLQIGLKKMILPIEQQRAFYTAESARLSSPELADFETAQELKTQMDDLNQQLNTVQAEIKKLSQEMDTKQRWWAEQRAEEEQIIADIFDAEMRGENNIDWNTLPDRMIVILEKQLEDHVPPLNHPTETQQFYSNRKRTAEEFFKKLILDPARFFDKLKEKEKSFVIATTRLQHDSHSEEFDRAYVQFKMFVNKYVERFNNMLILMGIKEEKMDYDYDPGYQGRAQEMKNRWAEISNNHQEKINQYREKLAERTVGNTDQDDTAQKPPADHLDTMDLAA